MQITGRPPGIRYPSVRFIGLTLFEEKHPEYGDTGRVQTSLDPHLLSSSISPVEPEGLNLEYAINLPPLVFGKPGSLHGRCA